MSLVMGLWDSIIGFWARLDLNKTKKDWKWRKVLENFIFCKIPLTRGRLWKWTICRTKSD